MSEQPRKRRFQIHLSTAIVLMFVAGFFLRMNFGEEIILRTDSDGFGSMITEFGFVYGWPFTVTCLHTARIDGPNLMNVGINRIWGEISIANILLDVLTAAVCLSLVWYACEKRIFNGAASRKSKNIV